MNTEINLPKNYAPSEFEDRIYAGWCEKGYFTPERDPEKKPFTIVIPPPNVTGQLHMGHALDETLQDILIRYKRMQGYCALWVPGTDHAAHRDRGQGRGKRVRKKEGLTKEDLGREKFLERVWDWKNEYGGRIIAQLKKLGSSCDWTRERFTMDEGCSKAVREVFVNLYNKGLIYQRRPHHQLVPALQDRPLGRGGRVRRAGQATSGTSATRSRTAAARSSSRPRVLRRCSAIPPLRSTRTTRDTRISIGKTVTHAAREPRDSARRRRARRHGLRNRLRQNHPRARPERLRGRQAPRSPVHPAL